MGGTSDWAAGTSTKRERRGGGNKGCGRVGYVSPTVFSGEKRMLWCSAIICARNSTGANVSKAFCGTGQQWQEGEGGGGGGGGAAAACGQWHGPSENCDASWSTMRSSARWVMVWGTLTHSGVLKANVEGSEGVDVRGNRL